MKKTMSLLLMSVMGMFGTYAFAGSAREDSVDRLQTSVTFCTPSCPLRTKAFRKKC